MSSHFCLISGKFQHHSLHISWVTVSPCPPASELLSSLSSSTLSSAFHGLRVADCDGSERGGPSSQGGLSSWGRPSSAQGLWNKRMQNNLKPCYTIITPNPNPTNWPQAAWPWRVTMAHLKHLKPFKEFKSLSCLLGIRNNITVVVFLEYTFRSDKNDSFFMFSSASFFPHLNIFRFLLNILQDLGLFFQFLGHLPLERDPRLTEPKRFLCPSWCPSLK